MPPVRTLDFGIELMDAALTLPLSDGHKHREIQYRDGLLLVVLTIWPVRRRGLAALTVSRHLEFDDAGVNILLYPVDTKSWRAESIGVPEQLLPYLTRYLKEIRPILLGRSCHDGFWASYKECSLSAGRLYDIVRTRIVGKFGKDMCLHDFRRAAATFLAMDAPEKIGLILGSSSMRRQRLANSITILSVRYRRGGVLRHILRMPQQASATRNQERGITQCVL